MSWSQVGRSEIERGVAMYGPLTAVLIARVVEGKRTRRFAGCLLGLAWVIPALMVVQRLNLAFGWWRYAKSDVMFVGMPLELLVGWAVLWGVVPQMVLGRLRVGWVLVLLAVFDAAVMPLCTGSVRLGPRWVVGEVVGLGVVLAPGVLLARWSEEDTHLEGRAGLQVAAAGMLFLILVPEICFALRPGVGHGSGWGPLLGMAGWWRQLALQGVVVLAVPGVSAVMEFAQRGGGTPIPYDPPVRLVRSGMYRYVRNPMQVSCAVVMLAWAGLLRNGWLVVAAGISIAYSAGIARWDEAEDLRGRFGKEWVAYQRQVRNWVPRWRPDSSGEPAVVYLARTCEVCSELRRWIERREPRGLVIRDAEELEVGATGVIRRLRYVDGSYEVEGIRAMGRVLEHVHLGWALVGCAIRLPGVWWGIQLVMDASGLGPRELPSRCEVKGCAVDSRP